MSPEGADGKSKCDGLNITEAGPQAFPQLTTSDKTPYTEGAGTETAYSIFTPIEKWLIVSLASIASVFSPLTANIYLPAIPAIAIAFHESVELINLTVTVYMVVQGVSPTVWGTLADWHGRRPILLVCMLILSATCIGLAVVPTSAYWLLLLLRCLQAAGSASTVAVGAGIVVDISTRDERGTFLGLFTLGGMIGPCLGPVLGGVLADKLGWRSIFWFLTISSGLCFVFMLCVLPETLRSMVGNGSIPPPKLNRPLVPIIGRHNLSLGHQQRPPKKPLPNPLRIFLNLDILIILIYNGVIYAVFYAVTTTISILFEQNYPFLNETDIGLCFLAIGGGMVVGSIASGRTLDWYYAVVKSRLEHKARLDSDKPVEELDITGESFPIEKTRLMIMPFYVGVFVASCIAYGWLLETKVQLAGPLIMQIIIGYCFLGVMNTTQVLIMDLFPSQGSSITAANNLVRCSFGAALVSVINLIVNAIGVGWTFVLLGGVCILISPLLYILVKIGPKWRERRRIREGNVE